MNRQALGKYIKSARENAGLSKFAASKALGYLSDGTINAVEQGKTSLPLYQIHRIAKLYGLNVDEVLDRLKEWDPKVYRHYLRVQEDVIAYFAKRVVSGDRSSHVSANAARHHLEVYRNIYYQNLHSWIQMVLDLRERILHDRNQKVLVFPHASLRRPKGIRSARNFNFHQLRDAA